MVYYILTMKMVKNNSTGGIIMSALQESFAKILEIILDALKSVGVFDLFLKALLDGH